MILFLSCVMISQNVNSVYNLENAGAKSTEIIIVRLFFRKHFLVLNLYSNSVSNKVESRRDETLLRTELRTNSATVNNEEYFLRNFG